MFAFSARARFSLSNSLHSRAYFFFRLFQLSALSFEIRNFFPELRLLRFFFEFRFGFFLDLGVELFHFFFQTLDFLRKRLVVFNVPLDIALLARADISQILGFIEFGVDLLHDFVFIASPVH
ncbi:unnamed protein product [Periconia digitata]|uniref:Uncharacterized protein n=1 Tax=Periconia digitata TaxID=1303443 RepID=A0A9W4USU3_9PLEO|nr:unnamed protein product [Periconia digitata]